LTECTVLGFDFGLKHIGVAVGQTVTSSANPLPSLKARHGVPDWEKIATLIEDWRPEALMVGIPYAINGSEQPITQAARNFADQLRQRFGLSVMMIDERYTTLEAKRHLFEQGGYRALNKSHIDGWSAKIITENGLRQWKQT
jgi:putative pre-16S rRNA nuclease